MPMNVCVCMCLSVHTRGKFPATGEFVLMVLVHCLFLLVEFSSEKNRIANTFGCALKLQTMRYFIEYHLHIPFDAMHTLPALYCVVNKQYFMCERHHVDE